MSTFLKKSRPSGNTSSTGSSSATKRLIQELNTVAQDLSRNPSIERLEPVSDDDLFHWQAVINGHRLGGGYEDGRWLLDVHIPDDRASSRDERGTATERQERGEPYPYVPPVCKFVTKICAPNVALESGEICLDLLKTAWTPAYTLASTIDAICQMLSAPEVDSPLNIDIAALLREGDKVGAESVIRWYCAGWRFEDDHNR